MAVLRDATVEQFMQKQIIMRLAYTGTDGAPRVIPIGYQWDGAHFLVYTPPIAPKVRALRRNPGVAVTIDTDAFPPNILLVRGTATIDVVEGVPQGYVEASRRVVPPEQWDQWLSQVTVLYKQMAIISVTPTWAKFIDFQTTLPETVEKLLRQAGMA
jgi:hypothetical protein